MRKNLGKILFANIVLLGGLGALTSCNSSSKSFVQRANDELAFVSTTALTMLDSNTQTVKAAKRLASTKEELTDDNFIDIIETADLIINNGTGFKVEEASSDKDEYVNLNVVSFKDYAGNDYSYKLYYNDVNSETTVEDDEEEIKVSYEGIALIDDVEYDFDFESKTENEIDETELETKLIISNGDSSKITIKSESENEEDEVEQSFSYKKEENGKTVLSYSLSLEIEENKQKVKIKYNGEKIKIDESMKDGKNVIRVTFSNVTRYYERSLNEDGTYTYLLIK